MTRSAVFLDRDGTLIDDHGYLSDPAGVVLLPRIADALTELSQAGYALIVITNQSGIGRGLYGHEDFVAVQRELERQLTAAGVTLDLVLHCPHTADAGCQCRKPGTALYRQAIAQLDLDPLESWYIGDRPGDLLPSFALGGNAILVRTGVGARHVDEAMRLGIPVALDLPDAVAHLQARVTP